MFRIGGKTSRHPVRAELELHGNAGDHAKDKVDAENAPPEVRSAIPVIAVPSQGDCLQYHDQWSKSHCELGKQVVECDREKEIASQTPRVFYRSNAESQSFIVAKF